MPINIPTFIRSVIEGSRAITLNGDDLSKTNFANTGSFLYEKLGSPLKSTQQLNIDWSKFENHTFFNSAQVKVNVAFDKVINEYPFDGTKKSIEAFLDDLTGFEKWIFDNWPKFKGELHFSGTTSTEDTDGTSGNWIKVKDQTGFLYPEFSKDSSGQTVLNPKDNSLTIELCLDIPAITNDNQIICQKINGNNGFTVALSSSVSTSACNLVFAIKSGSANIELATQISKGSPKHIACVLDKESYVHNAKIYIDGELSNESSNSYIGTIDIDSSPLYIGSGTTFNYNLVQQLPKQTLSGVMDEFRLWHSIRSQSQIQSYMNRNVFTDDDLKLYFKFNEPPPLIAPTLANQLNSIVLDYSGNSLHSLINNFTGSLRKNIDDNTNTLLTREKESSAPVLFPSYEETLLYNLDLLESASLYDSSNPNIITKLVPQHYLLEGQLNDGLDSLEGNLSSGYSGTSVPGSGQKGTTQVTLTFLYIWATFFDEIKQFIDSFVNLKHVDYDLNETTPDNFILKMFEEFGFNAPPFFNDSAISQYIDADGIDLENTTAESSLKYIQTQLMRRVLKNMPHIIKSKGTPESIKIFLRSIGIDPENSVRFKEYGGPVKGDITSARETKFETLPLVEFMTSSLAISSPLSASRIEPGYPQIAGTYVLQDVYTPNGISNNSSDGLLTSGSWTAEALYRWTPRNVASLTNATQSLCRIHEMSGSVTSSLYTNLLLISSSNDQRIELWLRPGRGSSDTKTITLNLNDSIFDNSLWHISFGVERNDSINSSVSSSYFIRAILAEQGKVFKSYTTSSYFYESTNDNNALRKSISGSVPIIALGNNNMTRVSSGASHLDDSTLDNVCRTTSFDGMAGQLRFWSKALNLNESREHARSLNYSGITDPLVNWNFNNTSTGSFEKLRLFSLSKQTERVSDSTGSITFIDYSQNGYHMTGTKFDEVADVYFGDVYIKSYMSPYFDESISSDKIRIRGYQNPSVNDLLEKPWASVGPVYEIRQSESPIDDTRFSIDISLVDSLNKDIMNMFSTFDAIESAIGSPELLYSIDYPDLDRMRELYFNKLTDKLNFKKFFEFYRWFDTSINSIIEQLVPRKSNFRGISMTIEPTLFERAKLEYKNEEQYLAQSLKARIRDRLVLQQIAGTFKRY